MPSCEVRWTGDAARARALHDAVSADDPDTFTIEVVADGLLLRVEAESIATLQATVDDLLACIAAAEAGLDAAQS